MCVARFRRAIGLVSNPLRTDVVVIRGTLPATYSQIAQEFLCLALIAFLWHVGSLLGRLRSFWRSADDYFTIFFFVVLISYLHANLFLPVRQRRVLPNDSPYLFAGTQL